MSDNLFAALPPVPDSVTLGGETIDITPLRVGELPSFARAVMPIADKLSTNPDWLRLLAEDGDAMILALAIACRRSPDWVSSLSLDDAILLAEAVFGANVDFFIRRVVPKITQASQTLGVRINGQTPSSGSSAPVTSTMTS